MGSTLSDEEYCYFEIEHVEESLAGCTIDETDNTVNCPKCSAIGIRNEEINVLFGECKECKFIFCTNCNKDFHGYEDCIPEGLLNADPIGDVNVNIIPVSNQNQNPDDPEPSLIPSTNIECEICFESTPIDNTTDLGCVHLYCNACIKANYETLIKDGNIHNLKCPSPNCGHSVTPDLLKELIDPEVFSIFDSKLLDEILQDIPEIVCCPKPDCGKRFQSLPEYGYCESCKYMFCTNCNQMYHGMTICGESDTERLRKIKAYIAADEAKQRQLEEEEKNKRAELEAISNGFIRDLCKKCPGCRADIEKSAGCDHMACTKCNTHFCWICLATLDPNDPYSHFQKPCRR